MRPKAECKKAIKGHTTGPTVFQKEQEKTRAQPCVMRRGKGQKKRINSAGANDCLDSVGKEGREAPGVCRLLFVWLKKKKTAN